MLSKKAKYGLKAAVHLARYGDQGAVLIADIAARERIPKKFLDTILLEMKKKGLLSSKKGKGGGYSLAVPPSQILVGDLVRMLDGPLAPVPCVSRTAYQRCHDCDDESTCAVRAIMQDVRDVIARILDNTTLADMSSRIPQKETILSYDI